MPSLKVVAKFNASEILFYQSLFDFRLVFQQDVEHNSFGAVGNFEPDDLWRVACYQRAFLKIRIATDDHKAVVFSVLPDFRIACAFQSQ